MLVPDDWADKAVDLTLAGLTSDKAVASGQVSGTPRRAAVVDLEVTLTPPCASTCTLGETRCEKAQIRLCQKDARGCAKKDGVCQGSVQKCGAASFVLLVNERC